MNNLGDLEVLVQSNLPWCLGLQEVNKVTIQQLNRSLRGQYQWILKRGSNFRHSVAIGILQGIPFEPLDITSDLPVVGVRLKGNTNLSIVNTYLPCGSIPDLQNKVQEILVNVPEPVMWIGDMNAHHPAWGDRKTDPKGIALLNCFQENDLTVLNDGSTTFEKGHSSSAIDISVASTSVAYKYDWCVNPDPHGSDHHPIQISTFADMPASTRRPRWVYEHADWVAYEDAIRTALQSQEPTDIASFSNLIYKAAEDSIPRTSGRAGAKLYTGGRKKLK